ncbi:MAG TPA: AAA family ATPase [Ktedonobacteraceae bacterium]|jgi:predicted ATPase/DNA-binding CsgD family transcriptional regulator|nr:AAA family ATPase [Ktedonobacteraceae bacterium]
MQASATPSVIAPILVGRAGQLETLRGLVDLAKRGEGHVTTISGEAGVGKSRLVAEAKGYAAKQGFLVLQGNCFPADSNYPYAPLLDLLRSLFASHPTDIPAAELNSLVRKIYPLLPEFVSDQTIPLSQLEPEQEKRRLFAVLANFFLRLSTRSPVLLIIEDVHWSDDTSLDFLHSLARHALSQSILLVATYRHDEIPPSLSNWLAQMNRSRLTQEIRLLPLTRVEVDTMLAVIFDTKHTSLDMRRFLHGELLDTLFTLTEGNPFFVEETLTTLIAAGDIFYAAGFWNRSASREISVPQSIQDGVQRRTEYLGESARHVLTLAAVAGRHFDFALLQQLTSYDEQQLLRIMKELVVAQLVVEESGERFAFRHALTRRAIYTQLLKRERRMLHEAIAETLEKLISATAHDHTQDASNLVPTPHLSFDAYLEDLAYHFYLAGAWEKTLDYAYRAGEKALRLYSHRAAVDYFTWALEAIDHLPSTPASPVLYRALGQAHETLGEFEQAEQNYTRALETARLLQNRQAEWQSLIDLGFLWAERDYIKTETWFRQALALAQSLADPMLYARSLNRVGNWYLNVEQPDEALRYHQEALSIFEQLNDPHGIAETLDLLGMASYLGGDLIKGTAYYTQAIKLFRETGNRQGLTSSLATLAMRGPTFHTDMMVAAGSLAEAQHDAQNAFKIAREIGQRSAEAYALFQLGLCLGSQGEYTRALAAAQTSLDIAEEIEHHQWQAAAHAMLGGIYRGLLALPQARQHFEQALLLAQEVGSLFWTRMSTGYLASTAIQMKDLSYAEKVLQAGSSPGDQARTMAQRLLWCATSELELARGNPARALEILDELDAFDPNVGEGQGSLLILKLRGEALAALQQPIEAEAAFARAREIAREYGARPVLWHIYLASGNLYLARGRNVEAEQEFAAARTLIEELATNIDNEPLRNNFLDQATALLPQQHPQLPKQAPGGLTAREREVALLIAQGKSNAEIAESLVVSKRTIETHIGNIMYKLGCTSRTQIAVWAVETGLAER